MENNNARVFDELGNLTPDVIRVDTQNPHTAFKIVQGQAVAVDELGNIQTLPPDFYDDDE